VGQEQTIENLGETSGRRGPGMGPEQPGTPTYRSRDYSGGARPLNAEELVAKYREEVLNMGCIFKKKWRNKKTGEMVEGDTLWIKYYRFGKPYFESTHSAREAVAKKLLRLREGEISKGEIPGIHFDKIYFDDLAKDYLTDYLINGKKSIRDARRNVRNLGKSLEGRG